MTPARLLERVAALVARASSSFEEEARTSAVIACRLIREHGLEVKLPGQPQEPPRRTPPPPREEAEGGRRIWARFASRCIDCGGHVEAGERVCWFKGRGVSHIACTDAERRSA